MRSLWQLAVVLTWTLRRPPHARFDIGVLPHTADRVMANRRPHKWRGRPRRQTAVKTISKTNIRPAAVVDTQQVVVSDPTAASSGGTAAGSTTTNGSTTIANSCITAIIVVVTVIKVGL